MRKSPERREAESSKATFCLESTEREIERKTVHKAARSSRSSFDWRDEVPGNAQGYPKEEEDTRIKIREADAERCSRRESKEEEEAWNRLIQV